MCEKTSLLKCVTVKGDILNTGNYTKSNRTCGNWLLVTLDHGPRVTKWRPPNKFYLACRQEKKSKN